ncbi:contractile injection system protein, VgrG/Pvc8 family [Niallia taxi]|uniref:phage late control D family protein n=1 Tax=Niallia taxi TaxID=2499688 RepID=UPI003981B4FD
MNGRRISYDIEYNGSSIIADIDPFVTGLSFTDNFSGSADDISLNLADKNRLWIGSWMPKKGASLKVSLIISEGWGSNKVTKRNLGYFEIDETSGGGPPMAVQIKAVSVPQDTSLKGEEKSRSWENTNLKKVVTDVAKKNGLGVYFSGAENPEYDRVDQSKESDGAFLYRLANEAGFALKIANKKVYIIDEAKLESEEPVTTIKRTDTNIKKWDYKDTLNGIYKACRVKYTDPNKKRTYDYTFTPSKPPATGKVLQVNEEVKSTDDAKRLAKIKLREANKEATTVTISWTGIFPFYAGETVTLKEFSHLDGKYIITSLSGSIGKGSDTSINLRKCLGGY